MAEKKLTYGDWEGPNLVDDIMSSMGYNIADAGDEGIWGYYDPTNNRSNSYGISFGEYQSRKNKAAPIIQARHKTIEQLLGKGYTLEDMGYFDENEHGKAEYNLYRDQNRSVHDRINSGELESPMAKRGLDPLSALKSGGGWSSSSGSQQQVDANQKGQSGDMTVDPLKDKKIQTATTQPQQVQSPVPQSYGQMGQSYSMSEGSDVSSKPVAGKEQDKSPIRYRGIFS